MVKSAEAEIYDPLKVLLNNEISSLDLSVEDKARARMIPLRVYFSKETKNAPVILFSHGLGGSRKGNEYLNRHLVSRGYCVVMIQHPGSDESVWSSVPIRQRIPKLTEAANAENFLHRIQDVTKVLDELERWNQQKEHPLYALLDLNKVGMSGHSFGAVTTQAVSGQNFHLQVDASRRESRIKAAIAYCPSPPQRGSAKDAFESVTLPWLVMTGTRDHSFIGRTTPESRREVFKALPPPNKYELVLFEAEHSAFTDRSLPNESKERNPNHHRAILALSTAFWDSYLKTSPSAQKWLKSEAPRSVLEAKDLWQWK